MLQLLLDDSCREIEPAAGLTGGIDDGIWLSYTESVMPIVKTAISLRESLFVRVNELAHEMEVPRSRVFVLALEEYIRRHENRDLLARINAAYDEDPERERKRLRQMRRSHRRIVEGEW